MLTIEYIPYSDIEDLSSEKRISKLLRLVKEKKIIILEGRLRSNEEAELIRRTMEEIDDLFKGIELSVVYPKKSDDDFFNKLKAIFVNMILGNRLGVTIIGPASVIKEIKQDPNRIQLLTNDSETEKKKKKK
ncbi:MAG: DUF2073 domain-containing protein [Candidatus Woesearchaeota archaeon]